MKTLRKLWRKLANRNTEPTQCVPLLPPANLNEESASALTRKQFVEVLNWLSMY